LRFTVVYYGTNEAFYPPYLKVDLIFRNFVIFPILKNSGKQLPAGSNIVVAFE
jgi:hypothetical protein